MNIQNRSNIKQATARRAPLHIGTQKAPDNPALDQWAGSSEVQSVPQFFKMTVEKNAGNDYLGRRVGRGEYEYETYQQVSQKVDNLSSGLVELGIQKGDRVATFAGNRPEWLMTDFGTMQAGAVHAPLYDNLPDDHVKYILNDSEAKVVMVDDKKRLAQLMEAESELPHLQHIVLLDEELAEKAVGSKKNVMTWTQLQAKGEASLTKNQAEIDARMESLGAHDIASMVYTSGSTGAPKGVLLAHGNWLNGIEGAVRVLQDDPNQDLASYQDTQDLYPSVLPLAHVMGRTTDYSVTAGGSKIAYPGSVLGFKRDLAKLKPTILAVTPLFHQGVYEKVEKAALKQTGPIMTPWKAAAGGAGAGAAVGAAVGALAGAPLVGGVVGAVLGGAGAGLGAKNISPADAFSFAVDTATKYQREKADDKLGLVTKLKYKLAEKMVFSKLKTKVDGATGGNIRLMISGGAPLDNKLEAFFKGAGFDMRQGYGLSETTGAVTIGSKESFGTVGRAISGTEVRISDNDEIQVRGAGVMAGGYMNRPEKTDSTFSEDGWFKTGDTGKLNAKGELTVTGRIKSQFKLPGGKYVRPEPLEDAIKVSPYIQEAVVLGAQDKDLVGALVVPNFANLEAFAQENGLATDPKSLASSEKVQDLIKSEALKLTADFPKQERVRTVALMDHEFTVEAGELTPSFKVKRNNIAEKYSDLIASMF